VGKTRYFRAKCINITRQMALTAAALLQTSRSLVCNLFSRRIGAILFSACFGRFVSVSWTFLFLLYLLFFYISKNNAPENKEHTR